jgi:hypothetical protein
MSRSGGRGNAPGARHETEVVPISTLPYALRRVHAGGREGSAADYPAFEAGWRAGTHAVIVGDRERAYALYRGERLIARFCFGRLMVNHSAQSVPPLLRPVAPVA